MQLLPTRLISLIQFIEILSGTSLMKFLVALSVYLLFPTFYQIYLIICISCLYCTALQCTILYATVLCCTLLDCSMTYFTTLYSTRIKLLYALWFWSVIRFELRSACLPPFQAQVPPQLEDQHPLSCTGMEDSVRTVIAKDIQSSLFRNFFLFDIAAKFLVSLIILFFLLLITYVRRDIAYTILRCCCRCWLVREGWMLCVSEH